MYADAVDTRFERALANVPQTEVTELTVKIALAIPNEETS
ncbi:hypothetical protein LEP1GSC082_3968 [Leptospira kirschneri str. H2]|nr:hypothetical protein LEP1GSC082_3968 [Leptospira kirschneri str. H2]